MNAGPIPISNNGDSTASIERYEPMVMEGHRAEFSRDLRLNPPVFHYIICREHSKEIIWWSQAHTLEEARAAAARYISQFCAPKVAEAGS